MLSQKLALAAAGNAATATYVDDVFSTFLYEGTNSAQTITNGIDLSGEGGMVWAKSRTSSRHNIVSDTERGTGKVLFTNLDVGTDTDSTTITSYNSNGFTMGSSTLKMNTSGEEFCSWTFRKCPGFFDVVTYTGNGSASGQTISHSLGSAPGSIWIKRTSAAEDWCVYHRSVGTAGHLRLNKTATYTTNQKFANVTSTSFGLVDDDVMTNGNGDSYVAYIFAHDDQSFGDGGNEAIIKCGSFNSTGSVVDINLGFEPQWLLIKRSDASNSWILVDEMRGNPVGSAAAYLEPNGSGAESTLTGWTVPTPTGFTNNYPISGGNFVYIAIRRPHKPPSAATDVFAIDTKSAKSANTPSYTTNFPVDFALRRNDVTSINSPSVFARLTLTERLLTTSTAAATTDATFDNHFFFNDGYGNFSSGDSNDYGYFFKRAPGFFDVVTYTGNGVQGRNISHSLGVAPNLIIVKNRDTSNDDWHTYVSGITHLSVYGSDPDSLGNNAARLYLNETDDAQFSASGSWDHAHPTATTFRVGDTGGTNGNGENLIAYLFATLPGISKVGSYTGTGSARNLDFGFTAGARFFLFKRTDDSQNWGLFDTGRGITAGNDYYITLNEQDAQLTGDYVDPYSAGISLTGSVANNSGATFIYLAIA